MTALWTPADYYAARIRAFGAWQRTQPQLALDVDGALGGVGEAGSTVGTAAPPAPPSAAHLNHSPSGRAALVPPAG